LTSKSEETRLQVREKTRRTGTCGHVNQTCAKLTTAKKKNGKEKILKGLDNFFEDY